ncbi:hypothetical protein LZ672_04530, partial [Serratia liquefaciens]|nr:hypothetical protein [Serratia liquefaciens]
MQKVGSVTETADQNGEFTNGNVAQGVPPTILKAEIFNTWQRELVGVVESSGISLDPANDGQLLLAIKKIIQQVGNKQARFETSGNFIVPAGITTVYITACAGGGGGGGGGG